MASGQTPFGRDPERPGEPDTGTPSDDPTAFQGNSSEAETAPAGTKAERSSQSTTPTYAESERDGWPTGPSRAPNTDAAVAAASAAAAAAVAAVSAAIAATSATNARASNRRAAARAAAEAAAKADAPVAAEAAAQTPDIAATVVAAPVVATPVPVAHAGIAAAQVVATPVAGQRTSTRPVPTTNYVRPAAPPTVAGITRAHHAEDDVPAAAAFTASNPAVAGPVPGARANRPVPTTNYVRSDSPPDVPGITRAPIVEALPDEEDAPVVAPVFSNEGFAHEKEGTPGSWKVRIAAIAAGILAAMLVAGSALADHAKPLLSSARAGLATIPSRFGGAGGSVADATPAAGTAAAGTAAAHGFRASRPFAWIASGALVIRTGVVVVGSVLAIVFLPIILGLNRILTIPAHAISSRMQHEEVGMPDFDADGNPRRKRRVAPFWLAFGGFYTVLALIIAMVWFGSVSGSSPSSSPSGSGHPGIIAAVVSPSQSASPSTSPTGSATADPTAAPPAAPTPTAKPTPAPTKKPTAKPTKKPTAKPTAVPTPVPTPKPTATPAPTPKLTTNLGSGQKVGTSVTFTLTWTPTTPCSVNRTYTAGGAAPSPSPRPWTLTTGSAGTVTFTRRETTAGTYTFIATCGSSTSAPVNFVWTP